MLRRDRRRDQKRSVQAINNKRQGGLYATWGAMAVALLAILASAMGASSTLTMIVFTLAILACAASLVYAQVMWRRERVLLGHLLPVGVTSPKPVVKPRHHRVEDTHRKAQSRSGATRVNAD